MTINEIFPFLKHNTKWFQTEVLFIIPKAFSKLCVYFTTAIKFLKIICRTPLWTFNTFLQFLITISCLCVTVMSFPLSILTANNFPAKLAVLISRDPRNPLAAIDNSRYVSLQISAHLARWCTNTSAQPTDMENYLKSDMVDFTRWRCSLID